MRKKWIIYVLLLLITLSYKPMHLHAEKYNRFYYEKMNQGIWDVPTDKKIIALTFDDGPDPQYTKEIAQLLEQYNARGTFFVIGKNLEEYKNVAMELIQNGHEIANHSYSHRKFNLLSEGQIREEVKKTEELISELQYTPIKLVRPPTGTFDRRVMETLSKEGYLAVLWGWDQDTMDWEKGANSGAIANKVMKNLSGGDIIIMHDSGGNRSVTIRALRIILPKLKELGYECVTVTELLREHPLYKKIIEKEDERKLDIIH